jgi:hypothetical protein
MLIESKNLMQRYKMKTNAIKRFTKATLLVLKVFIGVNLKTLGLLRLDLTIGVELLEDSKQKNLQKN